MSETASGLDLAAAFGVTPEQQAREVRRFLRPIGVPVWETRPGYVRTLAPPLLALYIGAVLAWRAVTYAVRILSRPAHA